MPIARRQRNNSCDILSITLLVAAALYCICLVLSLKKLAFLRQESSEWTTRKLLILSAGLVSLVRVLTILSVAGMTYARVRIKLKLYAPADYEESTTGLPHQLFYDRLMAVLFDLPNCMVVSTYVLLTLWWAEYFVQARLHTESAAALKTTFNFYSMVFNILLYVLQLSLYSCLFLAPPTKTVRNVIYIVITGINFTAVLLMLVFYLYLNIRFSGFPYRSESSKAALFKVGKVMALWSTTRVAWGIATLLMFLYKVELLQGTDTPIWSFVVLLLMFFVCEIIPILSLLAHDSASMECARHQRNDSEDDSTSTESSPSIQNRDSSSDTVRSVRWRDEALSEPLLSQADDSIDEEAQ